MKKHKLLQIFNLILIVYQFILVLFGEFPIIMGFFFLLNLYFYISGYYIITRYNYYYTRENTYVYNILLEEIFDLRDIVVDKIRGNIFHYKISCIRNDVEKSPVFTFNDDIPSEKFPVDFELDFFISSLKSKSNVIKKSFCRPKVINKIFSKIQIYPRRENNKTKDDTQIFEEIKTKPIFYKGNEIYYIINITEIYPDSSFVNKRRSEKIKKVIINYITSEKFLKNEFNFSRN
jgi:hypothetical protein